MNEYTLLHLLPSHAASDGAGVRIRRTQGRSPHDMDPFLLLDEIRSEAEDDFAAGFPPHPHRGIETLTYMIEGGFRHEDHLGNRAAIADGGAQWMSTGRGIIHSEMPLPGRGRIHGYQLWVNLAAREKLKEPGYRQVEEAELPVVERPGATVRVVAGHFDGATSPLDAVANAATVLDVRLEPEARLEWTPPAGVRLLVRPWEGALDVPAGAGLHRTLAAGETGVLEGAGALGLHAGAQGAALLLLAGRPLGEPIVQHGPFVMNTREQIREAIRAYETGTLVDAG